MDFGAAEAAIGYTFKDKRLLQRAFTLASFDRDDNNQVLEFFGDAILEFIVSEHIYNENKSEGQLTELRQRYVSDTALTPVSLRLGLDKFLIKSRGDDSNKKSVPSVYEAVIAAIYLDGGMDCAKKFVLSTLDFSPAGKTENYKGLLQEYLQDRRLPVPEYLTEDIGTQKKPKFLARVEVCGSVFEGVGDSKKQAEYCAAEKAYKKIRKN